MSSLPLGSPFSPSQPPLDPVPPARAWPGAPDSGVVRLHEQPLKKRIVLAAGILDDDATARLSAQLLTLDAEGTGPIRLELQNLRAELPASLTLMGILDVLHAPVHACVSCEIGGPALGVLVSCPRRAGYPNAIFVLTEPKLSFSGTVTAITAREQQVTRMVDTLYFRLAEVTGGLGPVYPERPKKLPSVHTRSQSVTSNRGDAPYELVSMDIGTVWRWLNGAMPSAEKSD